MKFKVFRSGKARTLFLLFFLNASYRKLIQVKIKLDCNFILYSHEREYSGRINQFKDGCSQLSTQMSALKSDFNFYSYLYWKAALIVLAIGYEAIVFYRLIIIT